MEKWFLTNKKANFSDIMNMFNISELTARLLVNRDINTPRAIDAYLNSQLDRLYSPFLMKDMRESVELILKALEEGKLIRIVGDYDVDGVMSVYMLNDYLDLIGARVDFTIPDRIDDGYGINKAIIDRAKADGVELIITCDNGIAALEEIDYARGQDLDVIVTDHHDLPMKDLQGELKSLLVNANAVVNPKRPDCDYPFDRLCGAAIVFKLIQAINLTLGRNDDIISSYLEFAAIATICDVVDLVDENRIIVKKGLEELKRSKNLGLEKLIEVNELDKASLSIYHIGFVIGPCINASGRLDSALKAIDLFNEDREELALTMAGELKELNDQRKAMTEKGVETIVHQVENTSLKDDTVLVVYEPSIHESIAGIIAGRVKDKFYKPTIVLTDGLVGVKGSARSIESFNIFEELSLRKHYLNRFGGHPMAAGMSLDLENVDKLRESINKNQLKKDDLTPKIYLDMQLPIDKVSYGLIKDIGLLEPYGKGNSKPVFGDKNIELRSARVLGRDRNVLKLELIRRGGDTIEAMIFRDLERFETLVLEKYGQEELDRLYRGQENQIRIDIVYYPNINEFMGRSTLQCIIESYRMSN